MNRFAHLILAAAATSTPALAQGMNLIEVASRDGRFGTLLAAVKASGLEHSLSRGGSWTVFAPTDEAFAKLPAKAVAALLEPANRDQLKAILTRHAVRGRIGSLDLWLDGSARTQAGDELTIQRRDGRLRVDGAALIARDIEASNGVLHVVDSVLLPPTSGNHAQPVAASPSPASPSTRGR